MTSVPDALPTLAKGSHNPGSGEACIMEYVALLAGEPWTDTPACTHPVLAVMAQGVNDALPDGHRHRLVPLIGRLFGTTPVGSHLEQRVLGVRLAVWCARQTVPYMPRADRREAEAALSVVEAWCESDVSVWDVSAQMTAVDAYAAVSFTVDAVYEAAYADRNPPGYAAGDAVVTEGVLRLAGDAAGGAVGDVSGFMDGVLHGGFCGHHRYDPVVGLLTGLLDEYDRLTGRTTHRVLTGTDLAQLTAQVEGSHA